MSETTNGLAADRTRWQLFGSSVRGAAHHASGLPNQDAFGWHDLEPVGRPLVVAAVADGHGHYRHFRAGRGAELAVAQARACAEELADALGAVDSQEALGDFCSSTFVPTLVRGWRAAVAADQSAHAFSAAEEAIRAEADDDPVVAYGSTLLVALLADTWVVVAQIGDGDVVALLSDGRVATPVPDDPTLDGRYTTSLCQASAIGSFRVAVIDRASVPVRGLLMATDGFGNAQTADPWSAAVGGDLVTLLNEHGDEWVGAQLPAWAERCASADGSGDDTTVVLAMART
jgi:serine/threonine protein phosphatase PrpC